MFMYLKGRIDLDDIVLDPGILSTQTFNNCLPIGISIATGNQECVLFDNGRIDVYMKLALWGAQAQQVPEPTTLSLLGLGLLGLGYAARRRKIAG